MKNANPPEYTTATTIETLQSEINALKAENAELQAELDILEPVVNAYAQSVHELKGEMMETMRLILKTDNMHNIRMAAQLTIDRWKKQATKH